MADVVGELDPETGELYYDRVIVTMPRQVGKTDFDLSHGLSVGLHGPGRRVWYTAQSGQHASDHFTGIANEWEEVMSPDHVLRRATRKPRRSNGSQALTWLNGSTWRPFPPTENWLHGKQADKITVDEAWWHSYATGNAILQGLAPTLLTRAKALGQRPQIYIQSTEGTIESTWFNPMLDEQRGRDLTDGGRTAFFDWGLLEDDDPTDLRVVASRHPGYRHLFDMRTLEAMADTFRDAPAEFARAFGNRRTGSADRVFPLDAWNASKTAELLPEGRMAVGAAIGVDGVDAAIVAAVRQGARIVVEVMYHAPGVSWVFPKLRELHERATELKIGGFAIDKYGPSATLADQAERAGLPLIPLNTGAVASSAANILSWITEPLADGTLAWKQRPHAALDTSAELATRRFVQDGAWTLGRRLSVGSIAALEAANAATWGADHLPDEVPKLQLF
ncbi:hypothetical protein [Leucobacter chironomi]|uniref:hypothetical protein n=1 Tax=Leucobacter chironomi TaxID=491918 RepID=UPI00040F956F|nr:hypothetical protein [Leucobacter chironomi]